MSNLNKKWSEMSEEEKKSSGGTRSDYMAKRSEAKERTQNHAASQPAPAVNKGTGPNNHYDASANLSPLEKQMIEQKRAKESAANNKSAGLEKASAYLAQGNSRDKQYDQILKDSGANNNDMNQYQNTKRNQKAADNKQARETENAAFKNYHQDMKAQRESSGGSAERKVDQSAHYKHMMATEGGYGGNTAKNAAVEQLMSTGQKFSNLDVQREMGTASTYNQKGLFKQYGGYENYKENHGVGSGNFQGDSSLGTMKQADDAQRQHFADKNAYYNSSEFDSNYGQYDWAQKGKANAAAKGAQFDKSFDDRQARMKQSGYGNVYGY